MKRKQIPSDSFRLSICRAWKKNWFLLTSSDFTAGKYNTMTVAWGSFGYMWNRPFAMAVVRPSRYTYEFMEQYPSFTLSLFPPEYATKLTYCGSNSGRDVDKIKECGLTPMASSDVEAPAFDEAELIVECEKIYFFRKLVPGRCFGVRERDRRISKRIRHRNPFGKDLYRRHRAPCRMVFFRQHRMQCNILSPR